jgi:hypothetical protein
MKSLGQAHKNRDCGAEESVVVEENLKKIGPAAVEGFQHAEARLFRVSRGIRNYGHHNTGYILVRLEDTESCCRDSTLI